MELREIVRSRRSVRAYQDRPVEEEKLQAILETVRQVPTAGNLQAYEVILVRSKATRQALARAALDQNYVAQAPLALVFLANPDRCREKYGERGETLYSVQDATIATAYAQLAATDQGLATVWVGAFEDAGVSAAVQAPAAWQPVAILPVGYAAESPEANPRRSLDDIVHQERG